jgi:hypothetical protein
MSSGDATRRAAFRSYGESARWLSLKPSRLRKLLFDCRTDLGAIREFVRTLLS